ncbi:MAG: restriction endonuclease subunit S, partial [Chloroflexota bacterium]|nr:restriction endonuclease subunit S [Chloroflexota bacterium]
SPPAARLLEEKRTALIRHAVTKGLAPDVPTKESGVPWLGEMPMHWGDASCKYLARLEYGDSLPSDSREDGDVPVLGSNGPVGAHSEPNTGAPVIVIGRKGSYGKVNFSTDPVFAIDTTYFVDPQHTKTNLRWLFYVLQMLPLDSFSRDSAVPGLSREFAYEQRLPDVPLSEQRAIAVFLDRETTKIDKLVGKVHRMIEHLQEYRTGLISAAVTGKIDVRDEVPPA